MRLRPIHLATSLTVLGLVLLAPTATASSDPAPGAVAASAPAVVDATQAPPSPTDGPCAYRPTPRFPSPRPVGLPPDPDPTRASGMVPVTLETSRGPIPLVLNRRWAPCTVQSFLHLMRSNFYDRTVCHRLTTYSTLKVLQCGDPLGNGRGGPGYEYKDELPHMLLPWPQDLTNLRRTYFRGALAMANAGPDTNGSQFFLTYEDSRLFPDYAVFGYIEPSGLRVLDRVAAAGVRPAAPGAPLDGRPKLSVTIRDVGRS